MIRTFNHTPSLLLDGHIIHVSAKFASGNTAQFADKYYVIDNPQQVPYDRWYVLPTADYRDVDLSNGTGTWQESIMPYEVSEINEVLFCFSGHQTLVYPMVPSARYFQKLSYSGMSPLPTNTTLRYLGCWKETDCYYDQNDPKNTTMFVRMMFLKDIEPVILRTYIDSENTFEKVVMHFLINRCTIKSLPNPTAEEKRVARKILHWSELKKGGN
jgi:hypothetical protein